MAFMKNGSSETFILGSLLIFFNFNLILSRSVISTSSNWVTCGISTHAVCNLFAVTFLILFSSTFSVTPHLERVLNILSYFSSVVWSLWVVETLSLILL